MAKVPLVIVKDCQVSPDRAPNDGSGRAEVECTVFAADSGETIGKVVLDPSELDRAGGKVMEFDKGRGIADTGEGRYRASVEVTSLTDPGTYELVARASTENGGEGSCPLHLRVEYREPQYKGGPTAPGSKHALERAAGSRFVPGNLAVALDSGEESYSRMMETVRSARESVLLQTYALYSEGRCRKLVEELLEKSSEDVSVNIILNLATQVAISPRTTLQLGLHRLGLEIEDLLKGFDDIFESWKGLSETFKDFQELMKNRAGPRGPDLIMVDDDVILGEEDDLPARRNNWLDKIVAEREGLEAVPGARFDWKGKGPAGLPSLPLLSYAVHEKMLIADGKRAVIGGRNLEDKYFSTWTDVDLYLEGPVVAEAEAGFVRSWNDFSSRIEKQKQIEKTPSAPEEKGHHECCFVQSRPWLGETNTLDFLVTLFQTAEKSVLAISQYIVLPDSLLRDAVLGAAKRGVNIKILMNSFETGQEVGFGGGYLLSLNYVDRLLDAGVEVYETTWPEDKKEGRPYLHAKEFVVDAEVACVGSFNLSIRSSFIESENLVAVMDKGFAGDRERLFNQRIESARRVDGEYLDELKKRLGNRIGIAAYFDLLY